MRSEIKRFLAAAIFLGLAIFASGPEQLGQVSGLTAVVRAESTIEILDSIIGGPQAGDRYTMVARDVNGALVLPFGFRNMNHSQYGTYYNAGAGKATMTIAQIFSQMSATNRAKVHYVEVHHFAADDSQLAESMIEILD